MTRPLHRTAALLSSAVLIAAAAPAAVAATQHQPTMRPSTPSHLRRAPAAPARVSLGTVKGRIASSHRLGHVDVILYRRETAQDGSKGWVVDDDQLFANDGSGLTLNKKSGDFSFHARPGTYRLEYNGTYASGHSWGTVTYGPGKPSAAPLGKSVTVRKNKVTKHINIKAAGSFSNITAPDPGPTFSPYTVTAGSSETVSLGSWPHGSTFSYIWQIDNRQKPFSFKKSIHVPSSAAGKSINLGVTVQAYGKDGAGDGLSTVVSK